MNYIRELNAFWEWALAERPSTGQVALYLALMSIDNKTGWQGSFTAPNLILQLMTGLSRQGIDKARSGLCSKGRIRYVKGHSNQAGRYERFSFCPDYQKVGTQDKSAEGDSQNIGTEVGTQPGNGESDYQKVDTPAAHQRRTGRHRSSTLLNLNDLDSNNNNGPPISPNDLDPEQFIKDYKASTGRPLPAGDREG